eukprot:scaffold14769_cov81-Phaeocystis_antarctica.AAC.1
MDLGRFEISKGPSNRGGRNSSLSGTDELRDVAPLSEATADLSRACARRPEKLPSTDEDGCPSRARIQSGPSNAAKGGVLPPPTIMAIATALPGLLAATAAPELTWLPLNVAVVDNDR